MSSVPNIPVAIPIKCFIFHLKLKKSTAMRMVKTGTRELSMPVTALDK